MANAALAPGALAKPTPKRLEKARRNRQQAAADRIVYAHVTERDGMRCRACGEYEGIYIHRHHLKGREFTTFEDVCCVCSSCHDELHVRIGGKTLRISGDAEVRNKWGALCGLTVERRIDGEWVSWGNR